MTVQEFSNEFDTLVSSYKRFKSLDDRETLDSIEFDEYEKSVFLSDAQEQLIKAYYSGNNSNLYSFEKTEEIRRYLSSLIKTAEVTSQSNSGNIGLSTDSNFFQLPNDVWFITYEAATLGANSDSCLDGKSVEVVPVTQDYFHRIKKNPFRGPSSRRALRLDVAGNKVEIVSKYQISKYLVRYIVKPAPIVLATLGDDVSIDGVSTPQTCALEESLHRPILELAVRLALRSKGINLDKNQNN